VVDVDHAHHPTNHSANARDRAAAQLARSLRRRVPMLDILMLIIAFAFFALTVGYGYACDRL
jgi:hypothetical protein